MTNKHQPIANPIFGSAWTNIAEHFILTSTLVFQSAAAVGGRNTIPTPAQSPTRWLLLYNDHQTYRQTKIMNCKNCNELVNGNYCSNCGQPLKLKRIDGHYIFHEIEHVLHFERGILFTVKGLLISPGQNIRDFITDNRSRLVKPIIFIIVTSLIYTIVNHFYHIDEGYVKFSDTKVSTTNTMFKWIQDHYGYSNIFMGIFIALWTKLFFRKYNYNFYEILILLCFVMGMAMLLYTVFAIFLGLTHINLLKIGGYVGIIYCAWAMGQFFDRKKIFNYVKALVSYILGSATFYLIVLLIGTLIDLVFKH